MLSPVECAYCGLPVPGATAVAERPAPDAQYCCYGCSLAARVAQDGGSRAPTLTRARTLLGVAVFLSMNVMVVNWMLYGQEVYGAGSAPGGRISMGTVALFRYLAMLFATPVFAILGWPIMAAGLRNLRSRVLTTDLLIVLGVGAAFVFSYVSVLRESGGTYFDTVCMILVLVTLGKYLEATAKIKTTSALHELETLLPATAVVLRGGEHVEVPIHELTLRDTVLVRPGSRVPVDGQVVENASHVDEQIITGESAPVLKRPGDRVYAGALNGEGALRVAVRAVGDDTVLHGVVELLVAARRTKGRFERTADRVTAVFVPGVLVMATAAAGWAYPAGGFDGALMRGLAVLLISCPCALGLATPMAVWVALGRAARRGVLFRNIDALEKLAEVRTVCFDKTGTLTAGQAVVAAFHVVSGEPGDEGASLRFAGGLARATTHHLSAAIVRYANGRQAGFAELTQVRTIAGRGVVGVDAGGAGNVYLGSLAFLEAEGCRCGTVGREVVARLLREGTPLACLGWGGAVRAVFAFAEELRPQAEQALGALRRRGMELYVLTGDHRGRGARLAERLGVAVEAELLPADKIARVRALMTPGRRVAMVGDGINDAPALAAADVGIAMGCGADVTRETADVTLAGDDLATVSWSIGLSIRAVRTIKQNLFWAFGYNTVGIGLAAAGELSPIFAALAMVASSVLVVTNSLRLGRIEVRA